MNRTSINTTMPAIMPIIAVVESPLPDLLVSPVVEAAIAYAAKSKTRVVRYRRPLGALKWRTYH